MSFALLGVVGGQRPNVFSQYGNLVYTDRAKGGLMTNILKLLGLGKKSDFTSRVLDRYGSNKPVSSFARDLFRTENSDSLNERFAQAKRIVSR